MRARRIVAAFADFGAVDVPRARLLDIGCSAGLVTAEIARAAGETIGVDVDLESLAHAYRLGGDAQFVAASAVCLPFPDATFDAVVCNHVYEHVPDAGALMREVHRVLRPGGACYFAGGHTLQLIEPHYRLPLLACLPRPAAGALLRWTRRGNDYAEQFVAPWRMRALFTPFAHAAFISPHMLRSPERFELPVLANAPRFARPLIKLTSRIVARLAPTWIYMLRK